MKIIDFHTHIFPDALANRAMDSLKKNAKGEYMPVHDFTCKGLISAMNNFGIDISVVMPVATKHTHSDKNMDWGLEIASDRVIPFAGLFPDDNWKANVDRAVSLGYKGIKLHPEYQNFILDDPVMLKRYDYALNKGLIILFHVGYDPIGSDPLKSNPKMFKHLLNWMILTAYITSIQLKFLIVMKFIKCFKNAVLVQCFIILFLCTCKRFMNT